MGEARWESELGQRLAVGECLISDVGEAGWKDDLGQPLAALKSTIPDLGGARRGLDRTHNHGPVSQRGGEGARDLLGLSTVCLRSLKLPQRVWHRNFLSAAAVIIIIKTSRPGSS